MPVAAKRYRSMEIKELQPDGTFEAILASYNTLDLGGDRILPGAFTKTIQEHGSSIPMLWQHKSDQPIGTLELEDGPTALKVKGQLLMELPQARNAYLLLKARIIKGMSIGYDSIKDSIEDGVRILKEVRLWEGSIVTFPMNPAAMVTSVKAASAGGETKDDFNAELSEIQLLDAGYQMRSALFQALGSIPWASGMTKDEKVAATSTTIDQFKDALMGWLPQYLDWLSGEYGDMDKMSQLQREEKDFSSLVMRGAKSLIGLRELKAGVITIAQYKEGRKFSAETLKNLNAAQDHAKSMTEHCKGLNDIFGALFDGEADDDPENPADELDESPDGVEGDDTSKSTAVPEVKAEPVEDHSAAAEILTGLRSLIPKA